MSTGEMAVYLIIGAVDFLAGYLYAVWHFSKRRQR
jgi:hypothetical protein